MKRKQTVLDKVEQAVGAEASRNDARMNNDEVLKTLKYYCEFHDSQQFAILIKGKWGCGKTFLINKAMQEFFPPRLSGDPNGPLYISLFGVRSVNDIADLMFQVMHPALAGRSARIAGSILKSVIGSTLKIDLNDLISKDISVSTQAPEFKMAELMGRATGRIVIFDDFERALMEPSEILGYINPLVEHDSCKVIILANEEEVVDDGKYPFWREKVIGQTLLFEADITSALPNFISKIEDKSVKVFLEKHQSAITEVFIDSQTSNLRIVRQFLWIFERFCSVLTVDQRNHKKGMDELLRLLLSFTIEIKANKIAIDDLGMTGLDASLILRGKPDDEQAIKVRNMRKRYEGSVNFDSNLIDLATIKGIIDASVFPREQIQAQLRVHPYFASAARIPSWRLLWLTLEVEIADVPDVMRRFEADFDERAFVDDGEILQVCGLCIWLNEIRQPGWEQRDVVQQMTSYINDALEARSAAFEDIVVRFNPLHNFGVYNGLGYRCADDERFRQVKIYLEKARADWRRKAYPDVAAAALVLAETDSGAFMKLVCRTANGAAPLAAVPILQSITPAKFISMFIKLQYSDRRNIYLALAIRYENMGLGEIALDSEAEWVVEIYDGLMNHAKTLDPIPCYHWQLLTKEFLGKIRSNALKVLGRPVE